MGADADQVHRDAIRAMTVEGKLLVAEALRRFAWQVKQSAIRRQHPGLTESEVNERVRAMFRDGGA